MKEYDVRLKVLASDLTTTEKVVMFAILLKVNWENFAGQVAISQIVDMTKIKKRTVQRAIKKLVELKWITRTSLHIERELSTAAYTTVLIDNIKGVSCMTLDDTDDTKGVSNMAPLDDTDDTVGDDTDDIHTISNNYISISNNTVETETHDIKEVDQVSIEGGGNDEFWVFPSSIQDPIKRRNTENYILSRNTPLSYAERQRLLHPELCKPILNN